MEDSKNNLKSDSSDEDSSENEGKTVFANSTNNLLDSFIAQNIQDFATPTFGNPPKTPAVVSEQEATAKYNSEMNESLFQQSNPTPIPTSKEIPQAPLKSDKLTKFWEGCESSPCFGEPLWDGVNYICDNYNQNLPLGKDNQRATSLNTAKWTLPPQSKFIHSQPPPSQQPQTKKPRFGALGSTSGLPSIDEHVIKQKILKDLEQGIIQFTSDEKERMHMEQGNDIEDGKFCIIRKVAVANEVSVNFVNLIWSEDLNILLSGRPSVQDQLVDSNADFYYPDSDVVILFDSTLLTKPAVLFPSKSINYTDHMELFQKSMAVLQEYEEMFKCDLQFVLEFFTANLIGRSLGIVFKLALNRLNLFLGLIPEEILQSYCLEIFKVADRILDVLEYLHFAIFWGSSEATKYADYLVILMVNLAISGLSLAFYSILFIEVSKIVESTIFASRKIVLSEKIKFEDFLLRKEGLLKVKLQEKLDNIHKFHRANTFSSLLTPVWPSQQNKIIQ